MSYLLRRGQFSGERGWITPDKSASVQEFLSGLNAGLPDPAAFFEE